MYAMNIVSFEEANLSVSLIKGSLKRINLIGADFIEADLKESNFRGANLREANFERADLEGANFREANLKSAIPVLNKNAFKRKYNIFIVRNHFYLY
jgi:uncharacterized protein YjbI with pentapeptide repeats